MRRFFIYSSRILATTHLDSDFPDDPILYLNDLIGVKQVAYLLGYSEVAAFNHAFHRWTGSSPGQYRRKV